MDAALLFTHIAEIIIVAAIITLIIKKLGQPNLLAYIISGVILGPLILGNAGISIYGFQLGMGITQITPEVRLLSALGAALLLFSIGIETSIKRLMQISKLILLGTFLQVLILIGVTILVSVPSGLLTFEQSIYVGTIVAFSSTMVVIKILSDRGEINNLNGRLMVSILLIQDFLVIFFVPILSNISNFNDPSSMIPILAKSALLIVIALVFNKFVFPRFFKSAIQEHELFFLSSLAIAFLFIGISEILGIPIAIGAFVGGLSLSTLPYNQVIFSKIRAIRDFFLTIFFVTLGLQLNFSFAEIPLATMLLIIALVFIVKPLLMFATLMLAGYGSKISTKISIMLAQISEFGFELAGIGALTIAANGNAVINQNLLSFLIAIIALSMIITPYLAESSSKISNYLYKKTRSLPTELRKPFFTRKIDQLDKHPTKWALKNHIIIAGGGTIGRNLAKAIMKTNQVVITDHDPEVVIQGQKDNLPYVYGHSESDDLWDKIDLHDAKLLILTILNKDETLRLIKSAKIHKPKIPIFATAHYFSDTLDYYNAGADFVSMTSVIGTNSFVKHITTYLDTGKTGQMQTLKSEFMQYLEEQVNEEKAYKKRKFEI